MTDMATCSLIRRIEPDLTFDAMVDAAPDELADLDYVDWAVVARFLDAIPRSIPRSMRGEVLRECRVLRRQLTAAERVEVMRIGVSRPISPVGRSRIGEALGLNTKRTEALYLAAFPAGAGDA